MSLVINELLRSYPRSRPALPEPHRRIYEEEYRLNREGEKAIEGLAKRLEAWMHRRVATGPAGPVLEVGAGTLNHLRFESEHEEYDVVEPFAALYENSPRRRLVRRIYDHLSEVPSEPGYARIISVAVLEHLQNLPGDIARCCQLLAPGGVFQAGIPSEGGFLWRLGWRSTTGVAYWMRNHLDYGALMRHEHLNSAPEIIAVARLLFEDVKVARFPCPLHHLSLYAYIEARRPRLDVAQRLLGRP